jgi:membrane protease YdiL (CAAX protease family)
VKTRLRSFAPAVPYVAIFVGVHVVQNAWVAILLYHATMAAILMADTPAGLVRAVRSGWNARAAVAGVAACAGSGILIYLLWPYIRLEGATMQETLSRLGLEGTSWLVFGVYFVTVHPLSEELGWRCYRVPAAKRPHWTDAAFAGYHILVLVLFVKPPWVLVAFAVLALSSWGWRWLVRRQGGLGVVLVSHAAADLSVFLAATIIAAP